ncbi:TetR/AcrR family transcriptional regulator [Rhodococcoides navarretei]|uniref:Helix-turn-helix domain-containing protein n=1 Tax=Rhodococcus navarretei TaxID=3128981 RepID=A0ABU9CS28_9NOCA
MGRTRSFDEATVVTSAAEQFRSTGYEGTSLDELLRATGLHRGSLYQAFGSKRGLFLAALTRSEWDVDLLLVALLELAPFDEHVREVCAESLRDRSAEAIAHVLGERLLVRAGIDSKAAIEGGST